MIVIALVDVIFRGLKTGNMIQQHEQGCCGHVPLKEILLEISFIEEIRTTPGNKEVLQTFFPQFPYSQKYVLIRLTPYHWQPYISQFCNITKGPM